MPIVNRIADFHAELTEWRRDLHAHPELRYDVHRTAGFVAEQIGRDRRLDFLRQLGNTLKDIDGRRARVLNHRAWQTTHHPDAFSTQLRISRVATRARARHHGDTGALRELTRARRLDQRTRTQRHHDEKQRRAEHGKSSKTASSFR